MLKVHTQKLGDARILRLRGRIVTGDTATLRDAVDSQSEAAAVVLDLARVSGVDAGGLGVMLELRERLQAKGIEFRLMNVTRLVRQVLEIAGLDAVFETTSEAELMSATSRGRVAAAEMAPRA